VVERGSTKDGTSIIMIDYRKGQITHIYCKIYGNEYREGQGDLNEKFDFEQTASGRIVRYKNCGRKVKM